MRDLILHNAKMITELHDRIHKTFAVRSKSDKNWDEWKEACANFHAQYDALAFPGGYDEGLRKLAEHDSDAIEAALCFLEVHPYFFRSQYITTKLKRLIKRSPLSKKQRVRLQNVLARKKIGYRPKPKGSITPA